MIATCLSGISGQPCKTCRITAWIRTRENVYLNYRGWDIRNLSALELLDSLRQQLAATE